VLKIADSWFELHRIDDDITLIFEPHVVPFLRCNIWHVRGRDRDLVIDTGMGIASLRAFAKDILTKPPRPSPPTPISTTSEIITSSKSAWHIRARRTD